MTDADGNFSISIYKNKRINLFYRMELRQIYKNKYIIEGQSFFDILNTIRIAFNGHLYAYEKPVTFNNIKKTYYRYIMSVTHKNSLKLVINYFNNHPLLSSKYLDYKD